MFMADYECQLVENAFDILIPKLPKLRVGSSTLPGASTPFNHIGLLEGEPGVQLVSKAGMLFSNFVIASRTATGTALM